MEQSVAFGSTRKNVFVFQRKTKARGVSHTANTVQEKRAVENLEKEVIPAKKHWSLRGLARYLQSDPKTIKKYDLIAQQALPAYRLFALNQQTKGYSPYRAWVLIHIIKLSRLIGEEMAGARFDYIVRDAVKKNAQYLTVESFRVYTGQGA